MKHHGLSLSKKRLAIVAGIAFGMVHPLRVPAQSFEVASLKPVTPVTGTYRSNLGSIRNGQVMMTNVTLSDCLRFAFGITTDAQIVGPDWIRDREVRFDIEAKAAPETPTGQLLLMLQNLVTERFKLALHREQRELSFLALAPGRKGVKMREAQSGSDASGNRFVPGVIRSNRLAMPVLATLLSRFLRETVVDQTGLTGFYEVKLEWTPDPQRMRAPLDGGATREAVDPGSGPSIFTAVQNQLGLRLESRKGPLEVIVVDHADKAPVEN